MRPIHLVMGCLFSTAALLSACGGGGDPAPGPSPAPAPAPAPATSAPGGLYVGYYQEDPGTNPEDPTAGAFSLDLPAGNGSFSGSMYFTYVGCQSSNVGAIGGTKTGAALSGNWSGTVDARPQGGPYSGTYDAAQQSYAGTYAVNAGKQFVDLSPCIQYTIAPNGTWEMFPIDARVPAGFSVGVNGRTVSWSSVASGAWTLVYVLDPAIARSTGNPVLWQAIVTSGTSIAVPTSVALQSGHGYVAAVGVANSGHQRLAFGSQRFTLP